MSPCVSMDYSGVLLVPNSNSELVLLIKLTMKELAGKVSNLDKTSYPLTVVTELDFGKYKPMELFKSEKTLTLLTGEVLAGIQLIQYQSVETVLVSDKLLLVSMDTYMLLVQMVKSI